MAKLEWDATGAKKFETGVDHGVLYVHNGTNYGKGVAWNGLSSISESPEGAEATAIYADNIKYLNLYSAETFKATIEAYTYPEEFEQCDGSDSLAPGVVIGQQNRKTFGLCYRTNVGDDMDQNRGYKIHIIYGCMASPSEKSYSTVNDSPEAITFSWEVNTTPINVSKEGSKPTATLVIDSTQINADALLEIENALYGTESKEPAILTPDEVLDIVKTHPTNTAG